MNKKRRTNIRLPFTANEDQKLLEIITLLKKNKNNNCNLNDDFINWKKVSNEMGNRSIRQCKERYLHYLSPSINKNEWTNEEDSLLLSSVTLYGKRWRVFEELFKNRTEIDIRNRFYVLQRKVSKISRSELLRNNINITNSINSMQNLNGIYTNIMKSTNIYQNKTQNISNQQLIQDDSDESFDPPMVNLTENIESNSDNKIITNFQIDDFFKGIADLSLDESKINVSKKQLLSLFNGRVYDCIFINDTTFS